jgi:hypothetical protein
VVSKEGLMWWPCIVSKWLWQDVQKFWHKFWSLSHISCSPPNG